jgi:hypothetical protein
MCFPGGGQIQVSRARPRATVAWLLAALVTRATLAWRASPAGFTRALLTTPCGLLVRPSLVRPSLEACPCKPPRQSCQIYLPPRVRLTSVGNALTVRSRLAPAPVPHVTCKMSSAMPAPSQSSTGLGRSITLSKHAAMRDSNVMLRELRMACDVCISLTVKPIGHKKNSENPKLTHAWPCKTCESNRSYNYGP